MSNMTKKSVLKAVAAIGKKSAEIGCNSASIFGYHQPKEPTNLKAQFDAIKKISQDGPCVIVGRCADYALEENPNVLSIFIKADMQDRIRRIAKLYDLSDAKAKDKITKIDKQRASYYNYYTSKRWGEVDSYDLCLNSSVFGIDGTVDMIKQAIEVKEAGIRKIFSI